MAVWFLVEAAPPQGLTPVLCSNDGYRRDLAPFPGVLTGSLKVAQMGDKRCRVSRCGSDPVRSMRIVRGVLPGIF